MGSEGLPKEGLTARTFAQYFLASSVVDLPFFPASPCRTLFLFFHKHQATVAKSPQSFSPSVFDINHTTSKNSFGVWGKMLQLIPTSFHVSYAIVQLQSVWPEDSLSPQKSQQSSFIIFLCIKHCFVRSMFLPALQRKCFNLLGHWMLHMAFQI